MITEHSRRIDEISSRGELNSGRAVAHLLRTAVEGADGEAGEQVNLYMRITYGCPLKKAELEDDRVHVVGGAR